MASELPHRVPFDSADDSSRPVLPVDRRVIQGGWLFLLSLFIFFLSSILLYGLYAYSRRDVVEPPMVLPGSFLASTVCLIFVSGLLHWATRTVRRDRTKLTARLLGIGMVLALFFTAIQCLAMRRMLLPDSYQGPGQGIAGMVVVLAILHALHVIGGIVALAIVTVRTSRGFYDHERHWPVDFSAHYWHFLDLVWIFMILSFWATSGGFTL